MIIKSVNFRIGREFIDIGLHPFLTGWRIQSNPLRAGGILGSAKIGAFVIHFEHSSRRKRFIQCHRDRFVAFNHSCGWTGQYGFRASNYRLGARLNPTDYERFKPGKRISLWIFQPKDWRGSK